MGSNINFRNFVAEPAPSSTNRPPGNSPLTRQSSVYGLTFDEFQNTLGGTGKDFGSMNMDELLKSIWSAEENQTMASTSGQLDGNGYLQRQGSLTLPRTLSQKTVDEVWRGISKEFSIGKDGIIGGSSVQYNQNQTQRQPTLGEMTLEEFLVRAGVVREDMQLAANPNNVGFFGGLSQVGSNSGLGVGFQQTNRTSDLMGMSNLESVTPLPIQSPANLSLNINGINGVRSNPPQQGFQQQQQQLILPKQAAVPFASQVPSSAAGGAHLVSPGIRGGLMGLTDQVISNNTSQVGAFQGVELGMVGLRGGPIGVSTGSPESSDGISRSNGETSSVSPVPYIFNGGMRGRKAGGPLEKVVERRHRRMIKNRESAARSRARKQAYTMELEAEVAKLKEENEELRKKQAEIMELQKNEIVEMMNTQGGGGKRRCLRRTQTGPW